MSHTETRTQTDEWEVEVEICDNCGHDEHLHHKEPTKIDYLGGYYIYSGCIVIDRYGRILPGEPKDNPYPRCLCLEFK